MGLGAAAKAAIRAARNASAEAGESFATQGATGGSSKYFNMGAMAFTRRDVWNKMRPMNQKGMAWLKDNVKDPDLWGMGKHIKWAAGKVQSSATLTGAVGGGAIGGVGGLTSGDRDMSFWKGATMGAVAGVRTARGGVSQNALSGGIAGAIWGGISDDTSVIGGAFAGAAMGGMGLKYAGGFAKIKNLKSPVYDKTYVTDAVTGKRSVATRTKSGYDTVGWGGAARATKKAMMKDIGRSWRGKRTRASKQTSTQGSNRGVHYGR